MVPGFACCQVSMMACRRRSWRIWCQKNGVVIDESVRFSSIRFVRSALSRLYMMIASSCYWSALGLEEDISEAYSHGLVVTLMAWIAGA